MRVLIIKTSSLGDVVHMLPALSDAARSLQGLVVDWVVEEAFAAVPRWHPRVDRVIPVALRRWRKRLGHRQSWREIGRFKARLREQTYAAIIDNQGLYKSALLACWARGPRFGYDRGSAREPLAALAYHHTVHVPLPLHAIERNRRLLAAALGYRLNGLALDYGVMATPAHLVPPPGDLPARYVMGLHGTSRQHKEWPESSWRMLGARLEAHGLALVLSWGDSCEWERAWRIACGSASIHVLPRLDLNTLAAVLTHAVAVVGVDTGLMHMAAALGCPGLALLTATDPARTGVIAAPHGAPIHNLAECDTLNIEVVWQHLKPLVSDAG
jgi:heptosyltransferase-1